MEESKREDGTNRRLGPSAFKCPPGKSTFQRICLVSRICVATALVPSRIRAGAARDLCVLPLSNTWRNKNYYSKTCLRGLILSTGGVDEIVYNPNLCCPIVIMLACGETATAPQIQHSQHKRYLE